MCGQILPNLPLSLVSSVGRVLVTAVQDVEGSSSRLDQHSGS